MKSLAALFVAFWSPWPSKTSTDQPLALAAETNESLMAAMLGELRLTATRPILRPSADFVPVLVPSLALLVLLLLASLLSEPLSIEQPARARTATTPAAIRR